MIRINLKRAASLGGKDYPKGTHEVEAKFLKGWFFKALVEDGAAEVLVEDGVAEALVEEDSGVEGLGEDGVLTEDNTPETLPVLANAKPQKAKGKG